MPLFAPHQGVKQLVTSATEVICDAWLKVRCSFKGSCVQLIHHAVGNMRDADKLFS